MMRHNLTSSLLILYTSVLVLGHRARELISQIDTAMIRRLAVDEVSIGKITFAFPSILLLTNHRCAMPFFFICQEVKEFRLFFRQHTIISQLQGNLQ